MQNTEVLERWNYQNGLHVNTKYCVHPLSIIWNNLKLNFKLEILEEDKRIYKFEKKSSLCKHNYFIHICIKKELAYS